MRMGPALLVAAFISSLIADARARPDDSAAPATRRFESEDHKIGIDLPAEWEVKRTQQEKALTAAWITPSPGAAEFGVCVYHVPGFRSERGQAYAERSVHPGRFDVKGPAVVVLEPMPHLVLDVPEGPTTTRHVWIYRVLDRNGFTFSVECPRESWDSVKEGCFRAARSLTSKFAEYPAKTDGAKSTLRDGYEYRVPDGVKGADLDSLHRAILDLERRYSKLHGAVPKPTDNPLVVQICADAADFSRRAGPDAKPAHGSFGNTLEGCLYALRDPKVRDEPVARAGLAFQMSNLIHVQCYGGGDPSWMREGEANLAWAEAYAGRSLPSLPEGMKTDLVLDVVPFEDLDLGMPSATMDQATAYVALFRAGPQTYRDAYAAYLKDIAATGDWVAAASKHLKSLDQAKLRAAAQAFLKELKFVKLK